MKSTKVIISTLVFALFAAISVSAQANLSALGGGKINVEGQNGKVVILAVGATWLPLSAKQAEFTNALAKKYAGRDVTVYFVVTDSTKPGSKNYASDADVRKFMTDNKLTVTILRDPDGAVTIGRYDLDQMPSFVILNKTGSKAGDPWGGIDPKFDITVPISKVVDRQL